MFQIVSLLTCIDHEAVGLHDVEDAPLFLGQRARVTLEGPALDDGVDELPGSPVDYIAASARVGGVVAEVGGGDFLNWCANVVDCGGGGTKRRRRRRRRRRRGVVGGIVSVDNDSTRRGRRFADGVGCVGSVFRGRRRRRRRRRRTFVGGVGGVDNDSTRGKRRSNGVGTVIGDEVGV